MHSFFFFLIIYLKKVLSKLIMYGDEIKINGGGEG